jgi:ribulose-bisphosphate carboxylase large chain
MTMKSLAGISRVIGVDSLHIGGLGKLVGGRREVSDNYIKTSYKKNKRGIEMLEQDWYGTKQAISTCSGGLHPGILKRLTDMLGTDIVMQVGGGVHGHPGGTYSGARALHQAITAIMSDVSVREYSKNHEELRQALNKWGHKTPK